MPLPLLGGAQIAVVLQALLAEELSITFRGIAVPLVSVLMTIQGDLKSLVIERDIATRDADAEASLLAEVSHAAYHVVSRFVGSTLQVLFYVSLQVLLVIELLP